MAMGVVVDVLGINCRPELHGLVATEAGAKAVVELCGVERIGPVLERTITADPDVSYEHVFDTAQGSTVILITVGGDSDHEGRLRRLIYKLEDVLRDLRLFLMLR